MPFALNIFDYDGVLVDSLDAVITFSRDFCRSISHDHLPDQATLGTLENMTYPGLALAVGLTHEQSESFAQYVFERLQAAGSSMPFYPGIESLLRESSGITGTAIVSGNAREIIAAKLAAHGLDRHITRISGAYQKGDKAQKIADACLYFGADPCQTCMIGDSVSDIRHAKKAGVRSIAVTWGWQSRDLLQKERPDYVVDSVGELSDLLSGFNT